MPKKTAYLSRGQRILNAIFGTMIRLGMIPRAHLMSVPGRKSGKMQTIPLYVLHHDGQRWLVAGYAGSDWVKNVRAAGWCEFLFRHRHGSYSIVHIRLCNNIPSGMCFISALRTLLIKGLSTCAAWPTRRATQAT